MQGIKRNRSPNFSIEEKLLLLNLVKKYKCIIENKKTNGTTWREKDGAWEAVTKEFNSRNSNFVIRSKENLKKYYENKKKEVRKQAAVERTELFKTGGGPPIACITDPTYEVTLDIINKKTVVGLENKYDDDANNEYVIPDRDDTEYEVLKIQLDDDDNGIEDYPTETQSAELPKKTNTHPARRQYASRRRPSASSTGNLMQKYEELADIKTEMVNLQCTILKNQLLQQKEQMKQVEKERQFIQEEWQIRKEAMILDIAIKKAQLQALSNIT